MGVAVEIKITGDTATPMLAAARAAMTPARLNPIVGRSAVNAYRSYLFELNKTRPNKLGGTRTNYYATAARQTHFTALGDDAVLISIPQIGIAQRYYGGVIKPKNSRFLTLPVAPEAYGHRASEFTLEIVFGKGGQPIALATIPDSKTKGSRTSRDPKGRFGVIMFLLVKSVNQKPDPTILPESTTVTDQVASDVKSAFDRDVARALQGGGNGGAS